MYNSHYGLRSTPTSINLLKNEVKRDNFWGTFRHVELKIIQNKFNVSIDEALVPTNQLHKELILKGAQIIRTHDVGEAKLLIEELKTMH